MDQNLPIVTKKLLKLMKVACYILKKNINKKKLLLNFNLFIQKGKFVAGKTLNNLLHHNNHHVTAFFEAECEFISCTNTPYFTPSRTTTSNNTLDMWEMMILPTNEDKAQHKRPNGLKSPKVRQLRITDSPYPISNEGGGGDIHVDEAADAFIKRFYSQLREQTC